MTPVNDLPSRFFADRMLGRLATWLRIFGFDTAYINQIEETEIIRIVLAEDRILLTRDLGLIAHPAVQGRTFFIQGDRFREQLVQVIKAFGKPSEGLRFSRCPRCNVRICKVDKDRIKGRLYPYVYQTCETFYLCPSCQRIYWQATHIAHIQAEIQNLVGSDC